MQSEFQRLRQTQLDRQISAPSLADAATRPARGWIRAVREALGVSSSNLASWLHSSRQLVLQFEKNEIEDRITLASLRAVANALDCQLVYAFVPRGGSFRALAEANLASQTAEHVQRVEHHMALEDQASGGVEELISDEFRRLRENNS
jgi:predicted DNA-binding mobile mystery protein A